jgi:hypothetical protein
LLEPVVRDLHAPDEGVFNQMFPPQRSTQYCFHNVA